MTQSNVLLGKAQTSLATLLASPFLDKAAMADDCLEVFGDYNWTAKPGLNDNDKARWDSLHEKGQNGDMLAQELPEFFSLTDADDNLHIFYQITEAMQLLRDIETHSKRLNKMVDNEKATIEATSKAAAASLLFDLESGDLNEEAANELPHDLIFDAVMLSSSLSINVNGNAYDLEPYSESLTNDDAIQLLTDAQTMVEHELTQQCLSLSERAISLALLDQTFTFSLKDETQGVEGDVVGYINNTQSLGLALKFSGYSDCNSADDKGSVVYIEKLDGELRVLVYADINSEEPTHIIPLREARNSARIENESE